MIYLYIIRLRDGTFYTGITNSIIRRMQEHARGKSKSTRHNLPVISCYITSFNSRRDARHFEVKIKHTGAQRWLSMNMHRMKVFYISTASKFVEIQK